MVFSNDSNMFGLSTTSQDDSEFNEAIENISNIENQSDIYMDSATNVSSIRASDFADIWWHCANDSKIENEMLRNLSNQTANQTLKKYVDLEIERTDLEVKLWEEEAKMCDGYVANKKGEMTEAEVQTYVDNIKDYSKQVNSKKTEIETYLNDTPELKQQLNDLNLDEDFLVQQSDNSHVPNIIQT